MAGSTTFNIRIVLSTNARDGIRDLSGLGDAGRGAGKGIGDAGDAAARSGKSFATLGGVAKEALASFAGYLSAQAVFQGLSKIVEFTKDTVLGFNDEMNQSLAIMGDVSDQTRKSMETTARETAVKYNAAVADVAQGYYFLASAGYDAATSQKAIGQVTAFAKAGMFDLEKATSLAADAQTAMGLKSNNAEENLVQLTRITDVLTKANIDANGSTEQFAEALTNKAAAAARTANISLEDTVAVLEAFASQGLKGLKAGEAFSIVLRDLQEKSRTNAEAFKALGITVFDAQGKFAGFPTIIGQIETALKGQSVEQANATLATLGFTAEGSNYIKALLGMSGQIDQYSQKLKNAGGTTQEVAEKQMQSMVEQLKHLKAEAAELALKGFDKLVEALGWLQSHFGPTFTNIGEAIRSAAQFIQPLVEGLAKIAGGAVVAGLAALAASLNLVTGFLRDHEGVVQALATVGLVLLTARLLQAGAAFASMAADVAAFKIYELAGGIDAAIGAIQAMRVAFVAARAEGAGFGVAIQAALAAITASVGTTALAVGALAALGIGIFAVKSKYDEGTRAADAFAKQVSLRFDQSSLQGMRDSLDQLRQKHDEVGRSGSTMLDRLNIPKMIQAQGEYDRTGDSVSQMGDKIKNQEQVFDQITNSMVQSLGPAFQSQQAMAGIKAQLDAIATSQKIDPTAPGAAQRLQELATTAMFATAPAQALYEAFRATASAETSAADAAKQYKEALDALFGVHIAEAQAENQFGEALDGIAGKMGAGTNLADAYSAANRGARAAVDEAASAALGHAVSMREEGATAAEASAVLSGHIERLVATMVATGMSEGAARRYIATLNLTPENIETTAHMNKEEAQARAQQLIAAELEAGRDRYATMHVEVGAAIANLNSLQAKLNYVGNLAASGNFAAAGAGLGNVLAGRAKGAITLHQYASGGFENHIAQVTRPGTIRLWGEPEAGGEAYIPLSPMKRERSQQILAGVASLFGYQLMPFAQGGIVGGRPGGSSIVMAAGAVTVNVTNPASGIDVRYAVTSALAEWQRQARMEMRTRRYVTAAAATTR